MVLAELVGVVLAEPELVEAATPDTPMVGMTGLVLTSLSFAVCDIGDPSPLGVSGSDCSSRLPSVGFGDGRERMCSGFVGLDGGLGGSLSELIIISKAGYFFAFPSGSAI